jgi:MerR family transcriptional regulator, light-induced transcriptional regulator
MLVPVPGSQHTLGLLMVAEFFRRAGWVVWGDPAATIGDLTHAVRAQWFDMAGFSMGTETQCDVLKKTIASVRKASLNPSMTIMVGGPVFIEKPELVERVGADATAADAAQAVEHAASLLARSRQAE